MYFPMSTASCLPQRDLMIHAYWSGLACKMSTGRDAG